MSFTSTLEELKKAQGLSRPDHMLTVEKGPPLPPGFEKTTGKHPLFFRSWKWDKPLVAREPIHMMTNVYTFDHEYLSFLTTMVATCGTEMQPGLDEEGFVDKTHVHKSTGSFGTVSGYRQDPAGYPLHDNSLLREELGLPNEWRREVDKEIYREWLDLFFSEWCDRPIKIANKSKSGLPHMIYDAPDKIALISDRLVEPRLTKILKLIGQKKLRELRKDHGCILSGIAGRRGQSDDAGKIRMVASEEYARTGGRSGQRIQTNKNVVVDGFSYPLLAGQRVRTIIGYNTIVNSIGQIQSTGHLYAAYERFPLTLKFAELQDKLDELCRDFLPTEETLTCFAGDVGNFDACALAEFRWREIKDVASRYWDSDIVALQDFLHRAPYCTPPLSNAGEFYWSGNPDDPAAYSGSGSLKSGDNIVTIAGIIEMVGEFLTNCHYAFGNVRGNVRRILEGDYLLRLWDKGDDHMVWGSPAGVQRYEDVALAASADGRKKYAYFDVAKEPGKQFIGYIVMRQDKRRFLAVRRIHSLHEKTFANEHGIGTDGCPSPFRPCWPIGGFVRKELYGSSNAYRPYQDIQRYAWKVSGCEVKYGSVDAILDAAMDKMTPVWRIARSTADFDVLVNPAKLNYRYHEDETVSPEVAALFQSALPQSLTTRAAEQRYGGKIRYRS